MSERTVKCSDCDEKIKLESVKWEGYYLTCGCDRKRVKIDLEDIEDFGGETKGVWNWGLGVRLMSKDKILNELSDQVDIRRKFTYSDFNFDTCEDAARFGENIGKLKVAYRLIERVSWMEGKGE